VSGLYESRLDEDSFRVTYDDGDMEELDPEQLYRKWFGVCWGVFVFLVRYKHSIRFVGFFLFVSLSLIHSVFTTGAFFFAVCLLLYGAVHEKKVGTETDEDVAAMNKKQAEALVAAQLLLEHSPVVRASFIMTDAPMAACTW
jgi:hypothetical protein